MKINKTEYLIIAFGFLVLSEVTDLRLGIICYTMLAGVSLIKWLSYKEDK